MKDLRNKIIVLTILITLVFSAERLSDVIKVSPIAYIIFAAIIVTILITRKFFNIQIWAWIIFSIFLYLAVMIWTGNLAGEKYLPATILEIGAIVLAVLAAHWVSSAISQVEQAEKKLSEIQAHNHQSESLGLGYIYREVRRARNHHRPLAIMTVAVEDKNAGTENISMNNQDLLTGVAKTLIASLEDCSIIVRGDDHFLLALPETKPEDIPIIIDRLRKLVNENIGANLIIGTASLPNDGYTCEGLVSKATNDMKEILASLSLEESTRAASGKPMAVGK